MIKNPSPSSEVLQGRCAGEAVCPLSRVAVGLRVCIKQLTSRPEVGDRLREPGLVEDPEVRLVSRHHNVICQICNAGVALSQALADAILVQPLSTNCKVGRVTPCAPQVASNHSSGAHGVTRPTSAPHSADLCAGHGDPSDASKTQSAQ